MSDEHVMTLQEQLSNQMNSEELAAQLAEMILNKLKIDISKSTLTKCLIGLDIESIRLMHFYSHYVSTNREMVKVIRMFNEHVTKNGNDEWCLQIITELRQQIKNNADALSRLNYEIEIWRELEAKQNLILEESEN